MCNTKFVQKNLRLRIAIVRSAWRQSICSTRFGQFPWSYGHARWAESSSSSVGFLLVFSRVGIEEMNYDAVGSSPKNLKGSRKSSTRSTSDSNPVSVCLCLSVCLSVCLCLSQVSVLSKRTNESSWFGHGSFLSRVPICVEMFRGNSGMSKK